MDKSADYLKKILTNAFKKRGEKAAFLRKTKFAPSQVESWLSGTAPTLETLDRIAAALEIEPWKLIKDDSEPSQESKLDPEQSHSERRLLVLLELISLIPTLEDSDVEELLAMANGFKSMGPSSQSSDAQQSQLSPKTKKSQKP